MQEHIAKAIKRNENVFLIMWNQLNLFYYLDVADVVHNHLNLTLIEGEDACNFDLGAAVEH